MGKYIWSIVNRYINNICYISNGSNNPFLTDIGCCLANVYVWLTYTYLFWLRNKFTIKNRAQNNVILTLTFLNYIYFEHELSHENIYLNVGGGGGIQSLVENTSQQAMCWKHPGPEVSSSKQSTWLLKASLVLAHKISRRGLYKFVSLDLSFCCFCS